MDMRSVGLDESDLRVFVKATIQSNTKTAGVCPRSPHF